MFYLLWTEALLLLNINDILPLVSLPADNEAKCTWSGQLPYFNKNMIYSRKLFLGGLPWDITESEWPNSRLFSVSTFLRKLTFLSFIAKFFKCAIECEKVRSSCPIFLLLLMARAGKNCFLYWSRLPLSPRQSGKSKLKGSTCLVIVQISFHFLFNLQDRKKREISPT